MPGGVPPDKAEGTLMNYRMVWQVLGRVLCIEAALMILPMVTALCYGETPLPFLISAAATGLVGLILWRVRARNAAITAREGFLIVGLSWVFMALFGALPFVIGGEIPNYLDALFEMVSGSSDTSAGRSRTPWSGRTASSSRRTAARSSSTRSERCRWRFRRSCCASSKVGGSCAWAARRSATERTAFKGIFRRIEGGLLIH